MIITIKMMMIIVTSIVVVIIIEWFFYKTSNVVQCIRVKYISYQTQLCVQLRKLRKERAKTVFQTDNPHLSL